MIKYSVPYIGNDEKNAVAKAVTEKNIFGDGPLCKKAESLLGKMLGARHSYLTTSGTHALELALMALGIKNGDEVICPSFTFVSTANAILRQGARPVFAEIEERTLNIDVSDAMRRVTKKTRAIMPVHYGGLSCDMDLLIREASRKGVHVIEDAAQAIGAGYNGKALGTFGDLGCFSFHSTKNITCGEGGAIIVNREGLNEAIQIKREKGTNRSLFLEGKIAKYTWIDIGSSFVLSDVLAALLMEQLKKLGSITGRRRAICAGYAERLVGLAGRGLISIAEPHPDSYGNGHIFWLLLHKGISRGEFISELGRHGIEATHHYVPLHSSPFGIDRLGYKKGDMPLTEDAAARLVRLPVHAGLSDEDVDHVADIVNKLLLKRTRHAGKNRS